MARAKDNPDMHKTNKAIVEAHKTTAESLKSVGTPDRIADSTTGQESAPLHD